MSGERDSGRAGPLFFLLGLITVFAIWLLMAVLTEDAPPAASPQSQGAAQPTWSDEEYASYLEGWNEGRRGGQGWML